MAKEKKEIKEDNTVYQKENDEKEVRMNKLENQVGAQGRIIDKLKAQFGLDKGYSRPALLASIALILGIVWVSGAGNWMARDASNYWDTLGNIVCGNDITAGGTISAESLEGDIILADAKIIVGDTGTGTAVDVSGDLTMSNTGAFTVTEINSIAVATVTAGAALGDTAVQPADIWGAPTATPSTNLLVNTVAIQAKNDAGGDMSEFRLIRVWTSETSMGSASTNNIETLVLSTGTAVDTVTAHADYRYVTATTGSAVATITATAAGTNYVMLSDGSSISATAITFE